MKKNDIPPAIRSLFKQITNKRARIVIDHILKHGYITTEELEKDYGYRHPPRAARDVREAGIRLETFKVKSEDGKRSIAAYKFGNLATVKLDRIQGRVTWPKKFKAALIEKYGAKCMISGAELEPRALQIDHRIPYQVAVDSTDTTELNVADFMLLSGTSNRAKSWSCEHCENWIDTQNLDICRTCYWAFPEDYTHVAMSAIRRLDLSWQEEEVSDYDQLKKRSEDSNISLPDYVKGILKRGLK